MSWPAGLWEAHLRGAEARAGKGGVERAKQLPGRENKPVHIAPNCFSPQSFDLVSLVLQLE